MIRTGFLFLLFCLLLGLSRAGLSEESLEREQGGSFAVLKANRVNVRRGPGFDHAVQWEYQRRGVPVEIIDSFENWHRIRDMYGDEGWIHVSLLDSSGRGAMVNHEKDVHLALRTEADVDARILANLESGVVLGVLECIPEWCRVEVKDWQGWVIRSGLWGIAPGELF